MQIGPVQLVVVGFERTDRFKGDILRELDELRTGGVIRVLDLLFVMKDEDGSIFAFEDTDLTAEEQQEYGAIISHLIGLQDGAAVTQTNGLQADELAATEHDYGLTAANIQEVAAQIEPGTAAGLLLVEHKWAAGLKHAIREAGGRMLAQGYLTPDALMIVGQELQAVVEAEAAIEVAEAIKGAAMLDALMTVAEAEAVKATAVEEAAEAVVMAEYIKTAAAAEAVQALIIAGLIEDAAAQQALDALVAADIIRRAMIRMDEALADARLNVRMLLQVHDELVFEVSEDKAEQAIAFIKPRMEKAADLSVPLVVEAKAGRDWGAAH
ncbi:MAG: hypothetical protein HC837_05560 [Chloroflexaceae bacterium]|nr:hypothetical protein [Chloroflexaceae bacterium]